MNTKETWNRLLTYAGQYRKNAIWAVICAVISVVASLIGPLLIGKTVDQMIGVGKVQFDNIRELLVILAIVYVIGSLFGWLLINLTNRIAYQTVYDMRRELFDKLNILPLSYHDNHPQGDSISRFVNDMDAVSDGLLQGFSTLLTGVITIVGALVFMLYISPMMTLVVLISAPVSYYVARFITTRSQQLFREQATILGGLNGYVEEMIGGQKVVQALQYEERSFSEFEQKNQALYEKGMRSQFYGSLSNPATRLVNNVTFSIIAIIGSVAVILNTVTAGELSSFLIFSNLFAKPFNEITGVLTQLQSATASSQRIFSVLDLNPEQPDHANALQLKQSKGTITFDKVKFAYQPDRPLITNFSLVVHPGTRIAIVGQTGAGKTTLVNLLMRFYDVNSGVIMIDGVNINEITRDSLRQNFGMVLQETWLYGASIRDNIAYGKQDATDEEVVAAAKSAHAHSFIKRLPEGYDTLITGAGGSLSQGQEQLLTIARVMLVDPPMLILDEATSSIDTRTEIRIQKAFQKMIEGRTSFVIAHRLSTIREADLILYMKNGDVVESGSHEQLLASGGHYAELYNSQFTSV
ncbi:ABC transporter ATP-binding protein [Paenibacillus macquariensis]|uniref:ATP-binding cassette, subfamily B n=1 Tax=Paenibacillus macquariensis TaxID=948756 RepID=A0ABY1K361_9BACL|nr:ABC transporter ATP-binding protein [Paenibacillus macquariensis]MEC0090332.1 ABC transporter ATP-binding protein [Paenibacillus macquariensis]OAB39687.1 sugar ABC transporter ATP-binding protein [Paenibacillus macquariensis subsp. macquariensis]SIR19559.1 ATP-binding cassette, subfamily B [Paenibacillus macquariensis]